MQIRTQLHGQFRSRLNWLQFQFPKANKRLQWFPRTCKKKSKWQKFPVAICFAKSTDRTRLINKYISALSYSGMGLVSRVENIQIACLRRKFFLDTQSHSWCKFQYFPSIFHSVQRFSPATVMKKKETRWNKKRGRP